MRSFYVALCKMLRPIDTFRSGKAGGLGYNGSNIAAFWRADDHRTFVVAANLDPNPSSVAERVSLNVSHLLVDGPSSYKIYDTFGTVPGQDASRQVDSLTLKGDGLEFKLLPKQAQVVELSPIK